MKSPKNSIVTTLIATTLLASALTSTAMAGNDHRGHQPSLADRLDHMVDLSDAQEEAIEKIEATNQAQFTAQYGEPNHKGKRGKRGMGPLLEMNPATPDYVNKVEAKANEHAQRMKAVMVSRAKTMQQAYNLLTEEQKLKLSEKIEQAKARQAHR